MVVLGNVGRMTRSRGPRRTQGRQGLPSAVRGL